MKYSQPVQHSRGHIPFRIRSRGSLYNRWPHILHILRPGGNTAGLDDALNAGAEHPRLDRGRPALLPRARAPQQARPDRGESGDHHVHDCAVHDADHRVLRQLPGRLVLPGRHLLRRHHAYHDRLRRLRAAAPVGRARSRALPDARARVHDPERDLLHGRAGDRLQRPDVATQRIRGALARGLPAHPGTFRRLTSRAACDPSCPVHRHICAASFHGDLGRASPEGLGPNYASLRDGL